VSDQESQELYQSQELRHLLPVKDLALKIRLHWKEHAPKMYAEGVSTGQLQSLSLERAQRTHRYHDTLRKQGFDPLHAWSQAMRDVALQLRV